MRRFFLRVVFIWVLGTPFWPSFGQTSPISQIDLGEQELRDLFHQSLQDPHRIVDFQKAHFFTRPPAEIKLVDAGLVAVELDSDWKSAFHELIQNFRERFWRLDLGLADLGSLFILVVERPIESTHFIIDQLGFLLLILMISCIGVCLFQIQFWSSSIRKDLLNRFGSSSKFSVNFGLGLSLVMAILTKEWLLLSIGLSLICFAYSYRPKFYLSFALFFLIGNSVAPLLFVLKQNALVYSAIEALDVGRNKINYASSSTDKLNAWQKSLWSYWNGDTAEAEFWIQAADPTAESEIIKANLDYRITEPLRTRSVYQDLNKKFPTNPLILFNLAQMNTQLQELVTADEVRSKIPSEIHMELVGRALKSDRKLLMPYPQNYFFSFAGDSLSESLKLYKSSWKIIVHSLLPWLLLLLMLVLRRQSSGLCLETGFPTVSQGETHSQLALQVLQKSESLDPSLRQKFIKFRQAYELRKVNLFKSWYWFCPGAYDIQRCHVGVALAKTFGLGFLAFLSLPLILQNRILYLSGFDSDVSVSPSLNFAALQILAASLIALNIWHQRKKGDA